MESIGELAQRTGTSRRMLRHWEAQGLLAPATVDPWTGQRRYASAQAGRVRAIAALRAVGFGLEMIRRLLDQGLTESRLLDLLHQRESELTADIESDTAALKKVQARLRSIVEVRNIMRDTLEINPLPAVQIRGVTEVVTDEAEIPDAVVRLLALLEAEPAGRERDIFLVYDGTTDDNVIAVSAAVLGRSMDGGVPIDVAEAPEAAIARLNRRPESTADAWIALDAELETKRLRTTGPYRQILHADGAVTLAAPIVAASNAG